MECRPGPRTGRSNSTVSESLSLLMSVLGGWFDVVLINHCDSVLIIYCAISESLQFIGF